MEQVASEGVTGRCHRGVLAAELYVMTYIDI